MKFASAATLFTLSTIVNAAPLQTRSIFSSIGFLDEVLIFDAPAYIGDTKTSNTLVNMESFVFLKQLDLDPLAGVVSNALEGLGLDVGDKIDGVLERLKLFAAIGLPGKNVNLKVNGCSQVAKLPGTSLGDLGLVTSSISVGQCGAGAQLKAEAEGDDFTEDATIFPSGPDGFGVISDIDDTVKISNVLDKVKLAKTTLIDEPTPVAGMPELYASLAQSLNSPQFIYVSGSPFQLYPFLRSFIKTSFPEARGPLFLRNLTITDPSLILDSFSEDKTTKLEYKLSQIARIQAMYPKKSFLSIGDSTEKDPEVYGQAFKTHGGDFIRCIWIHVVDGADNSDERFAAAFDGVPQERIRLFKDAQIAGLSDIDVAGGKC